MSFPEKRLCFPCTIIYKCVSLRRQNKHGAMKTNELERKLTAFIEVGSDGLFAVCTDTNPIGMISGFGASVK